MDYSNKNEVICLGDPKQAALYFEKVLPLGGFLLKPDYSVSDNTTPVLENLVLGETSGNRRIMDAVLKAWFFYNDQLMYRTSEILSQIGEAKQDFRKSDRLIESYVENLYIPGVFQYAENDYPSIKGEKWQSGYFRDLVLGFSETLGFSRPSLLVPEKYSSSSGIDDAESDILIRVSKLEIIDIQKLSWKQILDIRKDHRSRQKLRNLRLFLHANYEGKSSAFIEDDLGKRLDDYRNVCADYGFETRISSISVLLKSKHLKTFGSLALASLIFGEPFLSGTALTTGVSLEIAGVALELVTKRYSLRKFRRDHDLAYLIEIDDRLKKKRI